MSQAGLVYGIHAVKAVLARRATTVLDVWIHAERGDRRMEEIERLAAQHGIRIERRSSRDLDQACGGEPHQGALAHLQPTGPLGEGALDECLEKAGRDALVLVLDGVQDPHNLGACLRTADAAGAACVIVPRDRAAGLSAIVRKVASGAAETVPLIQVVNLSRTLKWLKERGLWLVGTDDQAKLSLHAANLKGPVAVVMGAEGAGMRRLTREHCDLLVSIPMAGIVESLNVSVAAGVVLYEVVRQRHT